MSMDVGQKLASCSGQDLTRRGAKSKNQRMMMVLPSQLAFLGTDVAGTLGRIEKANTENPELVIETQGGEVRYMGKFVLTSSLYFTVKLQPRQQSSVCEDVFDRVLVFENPKTNQINTSSSSKELSGDYITAFGCSAKSDPLTGKRGKDEDELEEEEEEEEEEILPTRSLPSRTKKEAVKSYVDKGSGSEMSASDNDVMVVDDSSSEEDLKPKKKSTPKSKPKPKTTPSTSKSSTTEKSIVKKASNSSSSKKRKVIDDDDDDDDNDEYEDSSEVEYVPKPTSRTSRGSTTKVSYKEDSGEDKEDEEDDFDEDEEDDFDEDDDDSDSDFSEGPKKKKKR